MKRLALATLLVAVAFGFAACSLNPQPFPPQDNGATGADASVDSGPSPFGNDAETDAMATTPDSGLRDASADAGAVDASVDAASDAAGDAGSDAESDATGD